MGSVFFSLSFVEMLGLFKINVFLSCGLHQFIIIYTNWNRTKSNILTNLLRSNINEGSHPACISKNWQLLAIAQAHRKSLKSQCCSVAAAITKRWWHSVKRKVLSSAALWCWNMHCFVMHISWKCIIVMHISWKYIINHVSCLEGEGEESIVPKHYLLWKMKRSCKRDDL